ncbi:hypothetical protein HMPREF0083_03723 [Aneurinibacillus aneurinilyticus ATCC 12856]|uniref:Uncharacterized protein n=1 Tax=Aneurinibacillus aneurinilyticus ATCC 12856 TaxID=649747 RepID=U1WZN7_ANEAE|nr:hypothetical protein HMPREF0083_03723 [Aneurinibacillus aneurinilyticus ATCC 12856]
MAGRRKFGKKKRVDAPCAPAEEKPVCRFIKSNVYSINLGGESSYI